MKKIRLINISHSLISLFDVNVLNSGWNDIFFKNL